MVTPDMLDDYWRKEAKDLLNEMDEITEERDMLITNYVHQLMKVY